MRAFWQRVTGWYLVILTFLLPLKFGSLALMPEQPPMFPSDVITLAVISWPPHMAGVAGAVLLMAALLFFPAPRLRAPGAPTALLWGAGLPLAVLPGLLNSGSADYSWCTFAHWWGAGACVLGAWRIFSADGVWKRRCLNALAAGVLLAGVDAWRQYLWGFDEMAELIRKQRGMGAHVSSIMEIRILDGRIFGTLGSSNTLAGFLLLTIPAALFCLREWGKRFEPVKISVPLFVMTGVILLCAPLLMTRSRGAWLCALAAGALRFFTWKGIRNRWKLPAAVVCVLVLAAGAVLIRSSGRGISSGVERLDYLRTVGIMCMEHPAAGAGWGEFFHKHMKIKLSSSDESARSPHNLPGTFACQAGIPAGLLAAAAMLVLLWELFRSRSGDPLLRFARWGVLAFLLHCCMELNDCIPASMVCCPLIALALLPGAAGETAGEPPACRGAVWLISLLICGGSFYANFTWLRSEAAFEELELAVKPRPSREPLSPGEIYRVLRLLEKAERLRPRSPYASELIGDFLLQSGDPESAGRLFERARQAEPRRPSIYRRLAVVAFRQGRREEAREFLAVARSLFPADPKNREKAFFDALEGSR